VKQQAGQFLYEQRAPESHKFYQKRLSAASNPAKTYLAAVRRDVRLLSTCLPPGVFVRAFEDRCVC